MSFFKMFGEPKDPDQSQKENKNFEDLSVEELENMLNMSPEERFGKYINFFPGIDQDMMTHYKDNDNLIVDDIKEALEKKKEYTEVA